MTIHYRHYRNYDNPGIVALWNSSMQSRGCCRIVKPFFLESQWFCKPWFEPACLSLAIDDTVAPPGNIVGLSLAGSGANTDFTGLDRRKGVISLLLVHLKYRRRKLGTALLQRAEDYLRQQGARDVRFGCTWDRYPFCWGMIGSICPAGVLKSMQEAHSFIATLGYAPAEKFDVLSRSMNQPVPFGDPRFPHLRRKYELRVSPRPTRHWFEEAIHGSIETMVFQLLETAIERPVASVCASEMTQFIEK
ncbi:MAG TPA: GNAT family N-acetyltransferase, partial [Gemmatales bacterium]|nr:GNAT family N-acetyltransferase [Gemmatales bacterium]